MQYRHSPSLRPSTRRGTSLIEILVVLVILVVGILSIVRLFPAGFIALRNAENATFADRLAQDALQALKKDNASLPDAVYMYTEADGFNPNYAPDNFTDLSETSGTGANAKTLTFNDINKQRYVSNETIIVPAGRVVNNKAYPPLHILNYGPIYLPSDTSTYATYLPVKSMPWAVRTGDSGPGLAEPNFEAGRSIDNPTDILQSGQQTYLVDLSAGKIAVPQAAYAQTFVLQVTRQTTGLQPPVTITVAPTASGSGYSGNWFGTDAPGSSTGSQNATGGNALPTSTPPDSWTSVTLYRPFQYKGVYQSGSPSTTFDSDPYEYAIYHGLSTTDPGGVSTDASMGILAFNPLASGQSGTQPLKARISYQVLDWHILHEDHDVPAGTSTVRLTLGHLKMVGDPQFDQTTYKGLVGNATHLADIMLLDLDTGDLTELNASTGTTYVNEGFSGAGTQNVDTASSLNASQYGVSYQNGRVTFPSGSLARHLRFFYAGDADWAVAVTKAPSVYLRSLNAQGADDTAPLSQATMQKAVGVTPTPNQYAVSGARVYFPLCDAGKTVEFDSITCTTSSGTVPGEATGSISTANEVVGGYKLVYVNLSDIVPGIDTTKPIIFQAVRGVSARATVIWHEHNRWRTRSVDTLLTQSQ